MSIEQLTRQFFGLLVREQSQCRKSHPTVRGVSVQWMPLPLAAVHVAAQAFDFSAEVNITQTYINQTPHTLESEYIFPLDENSAVCAFSAEINGRIIHGMVKEKSEAKKEFNRAKAQGKSTMLLEQKQENVFKISIGNLEANSECKIKLTYITTLDLEGKANRMVIPAVVAPKYEPYHYYGYDGHLYGSPNTTGWNGQPSVSVTAVPSSGVGSLGFFQAMTQHYLAAPSVDAVPVVIPPTHQPVTIAVKQQTRQPQRFSMQIEVLMPSEILAITSETHQAQIHVTLDPVVAQPSSEESNRLPIPHHATIRFGMNADGSEPSIWPESLGSKDFTLTIAQKQYLETRAVLEVDPLTGSQAVQLAFCPQTLDLMDASSLQTEIIFLIDQSGSMGGSGIRAVKSCLNIFLRSLPIACKFNLISFGSTFRSLFPSGSQSYNEQTITRALQYASSIEADLGGTEILPALQHCFSAKHDPNYPRQIFLLTDGQVTNTQELIDLTRQHHSHARLFTFGLGASADRHLVKSLAAAGHGEFEFIEASTPEGKQELNSKVMRQLIKAMQPSLTDIQIDWSGISSQSSQSSVMAVVGNFFNNIIGGEPKVLQCPSDLSPIFPPQRKMIYALFNQPMTQPLLAANGIDQITHITVSAYSNRPNSSGHIQGRITWTVPLNMTRFQSGSFIHKLAARARISEIQNWTKSYYRFHVQKSEVLKLALKYQLLSNYTSFIIVDDRKVKRVPKVQKTKNKKKTRINPVIAGAQLHMFNAAVMGLQQQQQQQPPPVCSSTHAPRTRAATSASFSTATLSNAPVSRGAVVVTSGATDATDSSSPSDASDDSSDGDDYDDEEDEQDDDRYECSRTSVNIDKNKSKPFTLCSSTSSRSLGRSHMSQDLTRQVGGGRGGRGGYGAARGGRGGGGCGRGGLKSSTSSVPSPRSREKRSLLSSDPYDSEQAENELMEDINSSASVEEARNMKKKCKLSSSPSTSTTSSIRFIDTSARLPPTVSKPFFATSASASSTLSHTKMNHTKNELATSSTDLFTTLINMSHVISGTWDLSPELIDLLNRILLSSNSPQFTFSHLTSLVASLNLSPTTVGTLLVIWTLERCFSSRLGEWVMLTGKAKNMLRAQYQLSKEQMEQITTQLISN